MRLHNALCKMGSKAIESILESKPPWMLSNIPIARKWTGQTYRHYLHLEPIDHSVRVMPISFVTAVTNEIWVVIVDYYIDRGGLILLVVDRFSFDNPEEVEYVHGFFWKDIYSYVNIGDSRHAV